MTLENRVSVYSWAQKATHFSYTNNNNYYYDNEEFKINPPLLIHVLFHLCCSSLEKGGQSSAASCFSVHTLTTAVFTHQSSYYALFLIGYPPGQ